MWAPADLFTPWVNALALSAKGIMSYFYERPLLAVLVFAGIVAATVVGGRLLSKKGGA